MHSLPNVVWEGRKAVAAVPWFFPNLGTTWFGEWVGGLARLISSCPGPFQEGRGAAAADPTSFPNKAPSIWGRGMGLCLTAAPWGCRYWLCGSHTGGASSPHIAPSKPVLTGWLWTPIWEAGRGVHFARPVFQDLEEWGSCCYSSHSHSH